MVVALAVLSAVGSISLASSAQASTAPVYTCYKAQPPACAQLTLWYSAARGDYFTTPFWRYGEDHQGDGGYVYRSAAGMIAHPSWPQPAGTVALWNWYSPSREDNFATTDPAWIPNGPNDTRISGGSQYIWPSLLGYVFTSPRGSYCNIAALDLWWNPALGDNALVPAFGSPTFNAAGYSFAGRQGFYDPAPC